MTTKTAFDPARMKLIYDWAADRYLKSLPPEHFMEAISQATQRKITLASFDLIHVARPDVQCFNELLVQYPRAGEDPDKPGQVVPDNMVVVYPEPIRVATNFATLLQPVGPLLVLEYVSKHSERKDYDVSYAKYEQELKVPYYLLFYPDADELTLFHLVDGKYHAVRPNDGGRYLIPELDLEVMLLGGWVRYWFRGELLPLSGDLLRQLNATRDQLAVSQERLTTTRDQLTVSQERLTTTRDQLTSTRDQLTASQERLAAESSARTESDRRAEVERQARVMAEAELARLREELAKRPGT